MDKTILIPVLSSFLLMTLLSCQKYTYDEDGLSTFIAQYEGKVDPLQTRRNQAQWDAYTTGESAYFDLSTRLSLSIDSIHQNKDEFEYLSKLREKGAVGDPLLSRQLTILYKSYLARRIDPVLNKEIRELASKIEGVFANYRTEVNGTVYSDNQVTRILKTEKTSGFRETIWRAQKKLGNQVSEDIVRLARLRNEAARQLEYKNYFEMAMDLSELDPQEVTGIFDELYRLSEQPFREVHEEIETVFARRYRVKRADLRPWHYEDLFAQEAPSIYEINLDDFYRNVDIPQVAGTFYASFNMPVEDILARSDLYEKEGKSQHAFSFYIDRRQDIRILCNIVPNQRWMSTMLHELGHAVYDKYLDSSMPYVLREPAHPFTTEGIAMLMDRYASNALWMDKALGISQKDQKKVAAVTEKSTRMSKLIFARWSMVMFHFEKALYENPGQDLNTVWWDLVEKYQFVKRPEQTNGAEWATKFHIAAYPVYYQNYQLGELFASQVLHYVAGNFYEGASVKNVIFRGNSAAGDYLKENIFRPGRRYEWNDMIEKATGEKLTATYFVDQYVRF